MKVFYKQLEEKYREEFPEMDYHWLRNEIIELSKPDRKKQKIIRRRVLIQFLHNHLGVSFFHIGKLLGRHHTSIISLYNQK